MHSVSCVCAGAVFTLVGLLPITGPAQACGGDQFVASFARSRPDVDRLIWTTFEGDAGFLPRTAFRTPTATSDGRGRIPVRDGVAVLTLNRFNPTAQVPGDLFWGSHIATRQAFFPPARSVGLEMMVRLRTRGRLPPGIVIGAFLFGQTRGETSDYKSEIDFELPTSSMVGGAQPAVLLNRYVDERPGPGRPVNVPMPQLDLTRPTELAIRWFPHEGFIEWRIDGHTVYRTTEQVPITPLAVHLNADSGGS